MDIFQYALEREQASETYYRDLAAACPDVGMRSILTLLADSELRHQQVVRKMQAIGEERAQVDPFLRDVKQLFVQMRDRGAKPGPGSPPEEVYRKAQAFEKESWDMYQKAAQEAPSEAARKVLHRLAAQERVHWHVLDTIVEMVSRPEPGNWLENAEWFHLTEY